MIVEIKTETNDVLVDNVPLPVWIVDEKCAKHYRLGVAWFHCSKEERLPGPLTERDLLDNFKWMSEKGLFSGQHDSWALEHVGFILGTLSQQ